MSPLRAFHVLAPLIAALAVGMPATALTLQPTPGVIESLRAVPIAATSIPLALTLAALLAAPGDRPDPL